MYLNARRGLAIVASAALLAAAAACTSGAGNSNPPAATDPGITADSILFGTHQPLTGPASGGYSKISPATKAYFEYINKTQGGVNGRKISYKIVDDTYNPQTTNTVVKALVEQDHVFAILNGLGTAPHTAVLGLLRDAKVPDLFVASGAITWNQPTKYPGTFAVNPDYVTEGKILGNYIKTTYTGKKVCNLGQGDDFGADFLAGIEKGLGAAVVAKDTYTTSKTDISVQIGKLKASGCEILTTATIPAFTAITMLTSAALGWHPQIITSGVGGDYNTIGAVLKDKTALLDGFITTGYLPQSQDAADPWIKYFQQINKDYNNNATWDGNIEYGMAIGWLTVEALKKAGPNLTRTGLIAAIEAGGYTNGPGLVPLLYSKTSHAGYAGVRLSKVTGTVQAYFGTPMVTTSGDDPVTPYTTPSAAPPEYKAAA
jgi:branched-chain amino acid transport system substrate-binding protein